MWWFVSPKIVFGDGALRMLSQELGRLGDGRKVFIVTDRTMAQVGVLDIVRNSLKGYQVEVFDEVEPEPSTETALRGAERCRSFGPQFILGLGGGSCMDCAKAIWVLYENPSIPVDGINPFQKLGLRQKARLVTISTTSGTGSEVTWAMILTDRKAKRKVALASREAIADLAIVDPILAEKMPPRLTSDTGLDALTHATEAYVCKWKSDYTDPLALQAIKMVSEYLPKAYASGTDKKAREKMHNAATIAGLSFGNSQVGIAHSMGHSLGAVFHIPHGRAVGLWLPYSIEYNSRDENAARNYAEIAKALGLDASTPRRGVESLLEHYRNMYQQLGQPMKLSELVKERRDLEENLQLLVDNSHNDPCTLTNPRQMTPDHFRKLFQYAFDGKTIDF